MEARGQVRQLADAFAEGEVEKASLRLRSAVESCTRTLRTLDNFLHDNQQLTKLVQELPTKVSHPVMVPFGKVAFFPGKLVHTNEFLVLLGEGYYAECSATKALEILSRRGKLIGSQIAGVKSQLADLNAESRFFNETFTEAAAGCVEIREEFVESSSIGLVGTLEPEPSDYEEANLSSKLEQRLAESKAVVLTNDDKEHELLMARLDEIEAAEAAAEMELSNKNKSAGCDTITDAFQLSVDRHAPGVVEKGNHEADKAAKVYGGVEGRPNLQNPGDLVKFEEWRRYKSREENTNQLTEMKRKHLMLPSTEQEAEEAVVPINSLDQVAPPVLQTQMERRGLTKVALADKAFTGNVIERSAPTPLIELSSQAAIPSQRRPASKFKTRQAGNK